MILTVTVGNRTLSFAYCKAENARPGAVFRISASPARTAEEYAALIATLSERALPKAAPRVAILASVVPALTGEIVRAIRQLYPAIPCLTVGAGLRSGLTIRTDTPAELGADLVACAVGAACLQKPPFLVLCCGDVTTLSAIGNENGTPAFLGCAILPGAGISMSCLKDSAALLSTVSLTPPAHAIGKNTADSLRSGLLRGQAAAITALAQDFAAEMGATVLPLIVTGEEAPTLLPLLAKDTRFESELAHIGLCRLAALNAQKAGRF